MQTDQTYPPIHVSPFSTGNQSRMENIMRVSFRLMEPEPDYEEGSLCRSLRPPEYWNRYKDQEILGRDHYNGSDYGSTTRHGICFYRWLMYHKPRSLWCRSANLPICGRVSTSETAGFQTRIHSTGSWQN